ncbi:MAG: histidinol dehydrogenase [Clostridia bacterium]|jgi:histidinol dehydrogenase|nr:histidinol dehydrogenase [Clostridia bacterium]
MIPVISYKTEEGKKAVRKIFSRSQLEHGNVQEIVNGILKNVKENGDKAVFEYTKEFDKIDLNAETIKVTQKEIDYAYTQVDENLVRVIRRSAERIKKFHEKQKINSWFESSENGEIMGQLIRPLENVGVYVPGGKAAYPSSVLMNVIPAHVAGVKNIYMTTPAQKDGTVYPTTIVAAKEAGVDDIFKIGGAQAIAALAFGTESVPKVDKICGPGNVFVALAKRTVYGYVNIDSVAGPSEILVLADSSANPVYAAADLLSQAEHDEMASAILITTDEKLAYEVQKEVSKQANVLERKEIIEKSIENFGAIIIAENIKEACDIANGVAPEHMEICVNSPFEVLPLIKNAGAIFLGHYTPEPLGDYMAGPNHVLPTSGTARFFSPLSIDDFIKKSSIISFSKNALNELSDDIITFANAEGLTAHANAVRVRK